MKEKLNHKVTESETTTSSIQKDKQLKNRKDKLEVKENDSDYKHGLISYIIDPFK